MRFATLFAAAAITMAAPAWAGSTPAPADATAGFANLKDGDTVKSPFVVKFAETGLKILPAGADVPNSGHYHLLIDTTLSPEQMKFAIPKDATHLHFGKGQTEASVSLPPGKHTLQVVMGDGEHELHNPPVMSKPITITVQ